MTFPVNSRKQRMRKAAEACGLLLDVSVHVHARKYPKLAQESWRRHGLLNPPTNPFLKDEALPRQRKWGERRSG